MDNRVPLKFHTVLTFEGMHCHVEDIVGQGSNAIVYRGWYPDQLNPEAKHHVLIKELFPLHPKQKIYRGENGTILVDPEAQDHWNLHRASFEAGNTIHLRLLADHPERMALGGNVNSYEYNGTLYTILGYSGGRSLQAELNRNAADLRKIAEWMIALLEALEAFHKSGYLHLDISPDNIMLCDAGDGETVFLIDYNSARALDGSGNQYLSCKRGYSAPEVETGAQQTIGFPSDLFSVAAVFFRCIMGRTLTLEEMLRSRAPDGLDSPLLASTPQTVSAMVSHILHRGLATLPCRRYQSIGQMRRAFLELKDRIDCVGVTHWSLWENGRRSVESLIRVNPALRYLKEELYPIRLEQQGETMPLNRHLDALLSSGGYSCMVIGSAGMGKTTMLLQTAQLQGMHYSPASCAVFYIPLNGWNGSSTDYIRMQILRSLRFRREENTFDSAMHALHQLLAQPRKTKSGDCPTVLLLLDGLNEVLGDLGPLIQEINELNAMAGVRIIAASRSQIPGLSLEPAALIPLNTEDVEDALGSHGLLIPREPEILQLLRTPLILSIYIRSSQDGKQPDIHSESELMDSYLTALLNKAQAELSELLPEFWQLEAALTFVLPVIAAELKRKGRSLTNEQLLKTVTNCWKPIHDSSPGRAFRHWIGHCGDILGDAQTPEQWYGLMVHKLLWQRMGLLVRDGDGKYRIFHQTMEEHLAKKAKGLLSFWVEKRKVIAALGAAAVFLGMVAGAMYEKHQTDEKLEKAIEYSSAGYRLCGSLYDQVRRLAQLALEGEREAFFTYYQHTIASLTEQQTISPSIAGYSRYIGELDPGSLRPSWSGKDFDPTLAQELLRYAAEQAGYYCNTLPTLAAWMESEELRSHCPDLAQCFHAVTEADADVVSELYQQVCAIHLEKRSDLWANNIRSMTAELLNQEAHRLAEKDSRSPSLEDLRTALRTEKGQLENRTKKLDGYLHTNIHAAGQNLEEIRKLIADAKIDEADTAMKELGQVLSELSSYSEHLSKP